MYLVKPELFRWQDCPIFFFFFYGCVFFSVCGQHANVWSYSWRYMCRYATPYPCCSPAWNTNRQHAHDTCFYGRRRERLRESKRMRKSEDEVGAKTSAWEQLKDQVVLFFRIASREPKKQTKPSSCHQNRLSVACIQVHLHLCVLLFIFLPWILLINPCYRKWT